MLTLRAMEVCSSCACEQFLIHFFNSMLTLMSRTWQGKLMLMSRIRQGQPMVTIVQVMIMDLTGKHHLWAFL